MPLAGVVTLIGVGLVVAALAVYLITVAVLLRSVSFNLGTIIAGVRAIGMQTEPLREHFNRINRNLASTRQTLDDFIAKQQRAASGAPRSTDGSTRKSAGRKAGARKAAGGQSARS